MAMEISLTLTCVMHTQMVCKSAVGWLGSREKNSLPVKPWCAHSQTEFYLLRSHVLSASSPVLTHACVSWPILKLNMAVAMTWHIQKQMMQHTIETLLFHLCKNDGNKERVHNI
jgi:hypothetical protein